MNKGISHVPVAYVELEVRDKNGKLLKKYRQPAHSWVMNFIKILRYSFAWENIPVTKQDGSSANIRTAEYIGVILNVVADAGNDSYGLLVGSGTKAYSPNDYKLDNKIPNGNGSGQLSYGEVTVEDIVDDGTKLLFRVIRTFSNDSGADITVSEVGLATKGDDYYPLIARDVLNNPVTVPSGGTLTVRYIIQYQYA